MVVEGPVLVSEAVASGLDIERLFLGESAELPSDMPAAAPVQRVRDGVLERVLDTVTSRPVAAIVTIPRHGLADLLAARPDRPILAMVEIADPGNAGTLIRSAEAAGVGAVISTSGSVDLTSPKVVRAAAGSAFRLPWMQDVEFDDLVAAARLVGRGIVASVASGGVDHARYPWPSGAVIVVGNEAHGLSPAQLEMADARVTIEMEGPIESLNAAMAGTLLMFECRRSGPK